MVRAQDLVGYPGVNYIPYTGAPLYNVLVSEHSAMNVEGLECETLDPQNIVARIMGGAFSIEERDNHLRLLERAVRRNDYKSYLALDVATVSRVRMGMIA